MWSYCTWPSYLYECLFSLSLWERVRVRGFCMLGESLFQQAEQYVCDTLGSAQSAAPWERPW